MQLWIPIGYAEKIGKCEILKRKYCKLKYIQRHTQLVHVSCVLVLHCPFPPSSWLLQSSCACLWLVSWVFVVVTWALPLWSPCSEKLQVLAEWVGCLGTLDACNWSLMLHLSVWKLKKPNYYWHGITSVKRHMKKWLIGKMFVLWITICSAKLYGP